MKLFKLSVACLCMASLFSCNQPQAEPQTEQKWQNEVVENIMTRRSIRNYKEGNISKDTLETILECGINAPNAINKQSWEVRVINTPEGMAQLKEFMLQDNPNAKPEMVAGCFRGAPAMIIVANDEKFPFSQIDCGLMSQNIMLSAWSFGIGTVCLASPVGFIKNSPKAMEMLGFSEGYAPLVCIGIGYPNESPDAKPRDMGKVRFIGE